MSQYRVAPPGFSDEQWEIFERDGIIVIEDALSPDEVEDYSAAIERVAQTDPRYHENGYSAKQNIVELDPVLAGLIDHPRHVGFAYDFFGEQLKLHQSQYFLRPPGGQQYNIWHPDGARVLPYGVFSPQLPLQIKIGYWLTDVPRPKMGNLVVQPGSHRLQYQDTYDTHESAPDERVMCLKKGSLTVMHSGIWHRVEPNDSEVTRRNIFVAYCPAWVTPADRVLSDPDWLAGLNREQRIIMRSYTNAYHNAKPPAEDFPLFLDRETGLDRDPDRYRDHVKLHRRKRLTAAEKRLMQVVA